jgi:iron complex outermembrane receptor protein
MHECSSVYTKGIRRASRHGRVMVSFNPSTTLHLLGRLLLLGIPLAWAQTACAQSAWAAVTEADFFDDLPVVLTASRITQSPLDAPAPVTVIDREMIRASGFTEIHDLFRLVPGFLVAEWPWGPPNVINFGMGDARSGRLQVLIDGHSVYNPFSGRVEWQELPIRIDDIERIEVVRGQNASAYGANSFQGVVNLITRNPNTEKGYSASLTVGNRDIREYAGRFAGVSGNLNWRLSLSDRTALNYRDLATERYGGGESIHYQVLNGQADYQLNVTDRLHVQLGLSRGDDTVSALDNDVAPYPRTGDNLLLQVSWQRAYAPGSELVLRYFHYSRNSSEHYPDQTDWGPVLPVTVDFGMTMFRDDLEFQQTHTFSPELLGVWGGVLRREGVKSAHYLYEQGEETGFQWQTFGNLSWQFAPKWTLNAGGMLERHYLTDTLFSPRMALNFHPASNQTFRLSAGRAYRAPTIMNARTLETFPLSDGSGIADVGYISPYAIEPEQVDSVEIGYVATFPQWGLHLDTRLFSERYKNYIDDRSCDWDPASNTQDCVRDRPAGYEHYLEIKAMDPFTDPNARIYESQKAYEFYNISGNIRIDGIQLQLDWRQPWLGRIVFGQTFNRIDVSSAALAGERDLNRSVPMHTSSLLWMRDLPWDTSVSVGAYYVDDMKWLNDGDWQPDYRKLDLRLAKHLGKRDSGDELAVTFQNLTGKYPEFHSQLFTAERRAFATLRLSW